MGGWADTENSHWFGRLPHSRPQQLKFKLPVASVIDRLMMSYGTDVLDTWHQVGIYISRILKGAKPADLPVVQASRVHHQPSNGAGTWHRGAQRFAISRRRGNRVTCSVCCTCSGLELADFVAKVVDDFCDR